VAGGPAFYFLNEDTGGGTSPATFHFIKAPGICAIFQDVNRTELDIQTSSGKAVQFNVPNPTGGAAELDFFLNNKLGMLMLENLNSFLVNTQLRTPETTGTHASPIFSFGDIIAGVTHEWKLLANTSDQLEIDHDAALILTLSPTILGAPALALGTPLEVAYGGTGTATGSITGTGALTFAAGGSDQDITLVPSGAGYVAIGGAHKIVLGNVTEINSGLYFHISGSQNFYIGPGDTPWGAGQPLLAASYYGWKFITAGIERLAIATDGAITVGKQLISTLAIGTAPLAVTSTTLVTNLNAERVGGTRITNVAAAGQVLVGTGDGTAEWQSP
jgi:hypothetical protein